MFVRRVVVAVLVTLSLAAACSSDGDDVGTTPASTEPPAIFFEGYASDVYAADEHWLCRPDLADDPCTTNLDATVIAADGSTEVEPFVAADAPAFDCFYVYPTVRSNPEGNAPFDGDYKQELFTVRTQAARFGVHCGVYAPVYRQRSLAAPANSTIDFSEVAYADVLDAFKYYMGNLNEGRPFVLMGHSQGSGHLRRLIAEEIDPNAARRGRLISALLLGSSVGVPEGEDVGGSFRNVPACRSNTQVGCVISYASFRSTAPPPANSFFGRSREAGQRALCTNPADLGGDAGPLVSYFAAKDEGQIIGRGFAFFAPDVIDPPEITTPYVALPDLITSKCVATETHTYLELTLQSDPGARADEIVGDLTPEWGMHTVDTNVALGNLVDLVGQQGDAWIAAH
jgi:hypothetical protein